MDWDKLRIFHKVADAGSLTHAGEELHMSQSAVSRQIRALEESIDATLFRRHARGLILTEQGELLHKATSEMSSQLDAASARIRDAEEGAIGELRVTTTFGFGTMWLIGRLGRLLDQYPELKIDLRLDEAVLDLPMREADVAIRMKEPSQADLVRRRLMDVRIQLFATQAYLDRAGTPKKPGDLAKHTLLTQPVDTAQPNASALWSNTLLSTHEPRVVSINSYFGVLEAVQSNLGIGVLPDYLQYEAPELVRVLPDEESEIVPVFLAYPEELRHSKRVAVFRDFVLDEIAENRKARRQNT